MARMKKMLALGASGALLVAAPAFGGEITGSGKSTPLNGKSICMFSGLNDDPSGTQGEGPGGRTQSFGQDVAKWGLDPKDFNPGDICNPNILPMK